MIDQHDDDIRSLIAAERDRAPLPLAWNEIVDRHDRRTVDRHRPMLLAAAATLAIGLLGLVAIAVMRTVDEEPADTPPAPSITSPATDTTVGVSDPLAGLTRNEWVVPARLPDGYTRLIAGIGRSSENSQWQRFGTADGAEHVTLQVMGFTVNPYDDEGETVVIDGITWRRRTGGTIAGVGEYIDLYRSVNRRLVTLSAVGDPDVLEQIARALVVVPGDEIDFEYLDPSGPYTDVASLDTDAGAITLRVIGLNGYYCWAINDSSTGSGANGGCSSTTAPDHPIAVMGGLGGPNGTYEVGLAEPDVVGIDFDTANGTVAGVIPVDESGQFYQRFWIAVTSGPATLRDALGVTVHLDDGSTIDLDRTPIGEWRIPTGT